MADVSRLKKRGGLGTPPTLDEAATSLMAPEIAPAKLEQSPTVTTKPVEQSAQSKGSPGNDIKSVAAYYRDGRSARKTNRTLAFATRVSPQFDREIRHIADREGLKLVEVMEQALEALKEKLNR
jgi:hypothetical protein